MAINRTQKRQAVLEYAEARGRPPGRDQGAGYRAASEGMFRTMERSGLITWTGPMAHDRRTQGAMAGMCGGDAWMLTDRGRQVLEQWRWKHGRVFA